jgi:hypothetical protein
VPKIAASDVAARILDAVAADADEVLADAPSHLLKETLAGPPQGLEL